MFEDLFTRPAAVHLYRTAPLAEDRRRYLVHCAERGAKHETLRKIAKDQLCLVRLLDLQNDDKVTRSQVDAASKAPSRPGYRLHPRPASFHNRKRFVGNSVLKHRSTGRVRPDRGQARRDTHAAWGPENGPQLHEHPSGQHQGPVRGVARQGAEFLTPPMDRGAEIRCYMRDPDGYIIEVGEATGMLEMLED